MPVRDFWLFEFEADRGLVRKPEEERWLHHDLDEPAAIAFAVELEEEDALPGAQTELAVANEIDSPAPPSSIDMQ